MTKISPLDPGGLEKACKAAIEQYNMLRPPQWGKVVGAAITAYRWHLYEKSHAGGGEIQVAARAKLAADRKRATEVVRQLRANPAGTSAAEDEAIHLLETYLAEEAP
jgi:hypothetical protein